MRRGKRRRREKGSRSETKRESQKLNLLPQVPAFWKYFFESVETMQDTFVLYQLFQFQWQYKYRVSKSPGLSDMNIPQNCRYNADQCKYQNIDLTQNIHIDIIKRVELVLVTITAVVKKCHTEIVTFQIFTSMAQWKKFSFSWSFQQCHFFKLLGNVQP